MLKIIHTRKIIAFRAGLRHGAIIFQLKCKGKSITMSEI